MPKASQPAGDCVYQLKVTLRGIRPPIWRRIQVPSDITLARLHRVLQITMGWSDSHLHQFRVRETTYVIPDPDDLWLWGPKPRDERRAKLSEVASSEKARFLYEYDFGDGWEHEILVEKVLPPEEGRHYPFCLKGKRACPPEDCGGVWGYFELLEAIGDPDNPDHEDRLEWIGGSFDSEAFDLEGVNEQLLALSRSRRRRGMEP